MISTLRSAVLVYNPKSGRQVATRQLPKVEQAIRLAGYEAKSIATSGPGDATRLAREAVETGAEVVFAMGGDGTLREAARGLLGTECALGLLPTGTTNVLSLALGLPRNALAAARVLPRCGRRRIDVGLVGDEPFLMQASGGLDAAVMAQQSSAAKKRFGKAAVAWTAVGRWLSYSYPEFDLRFEGRTERVSHFAVCNIPYYAGPFQMAPGAELSDGRLDLVVFRGTGRMATVSFARDLALGRHLKRQDVELIRVGKVEVMRPREILLQLDGDVLAFSTPLSISISCAMLWVLAPLVDA